MLKLKFLAILQMSQVAQHHMGSVAYLTSAVEQSLQDGTQTFQSDP